MGDVMLARSVGERILSDGPGSVFEAVADDLAAADVTVANLECVISERGTRASKRYTFRAPTAAAAALVEAGVDLVGVANNHAFDYGATAFVDALVELEGQGITPLGGGRDAATAGAATVVEVNGLRVAFLAYAGEIVERSGWRAADVEAAAETPGIAIGRPDAVRRAVAAAAASADVVIVLLHAGVEGSATPSAEQRRVAGAAIDAGASLVVGSHPHVLQGTWRAGGTLVAWSLGNFVFDGFDGFYGGRATDSAILDVTVDGEGVARFDWLPVVIEDGLPEPARADEAERIDRQVSRAIAPLTAE